MKKLSTYLFLILFSFQTTSWTDDIRDFEIEGMSVGDSLLDYFSKEEIENFFKAKNAVNYYPKSKKFFSLATFSIERIYSQINFGLKDLDDKYIIYSLIGLKEMTYQECVEESKSIVSEINKLFTRENFSTDSYEKEHEADISGKSRLYSHDFNFDDGNVIRINCVNWTEEMIAEGYGNSLTIRINLKEWVDWLWTAY